MMLQFKWIIEVPRSTGISKRYDSNDLGHGNYIRNDTLSFKSPIMASCSTKPSLHFISYADATCLVNNVVY